MAPPGALPDAKRYLVALLSRRIMTVFRSLILLATAAFVFAACTAGQQSGEAVPMDEITVEGTVTVRGNEPFAAYLLQTDQNNYYVLRFPDVEAPSTPAALRVTGRLYRANWDARPFAHIDVSSYESLR
ncbi:MAG: hypothetical protein WD423_05330 [Rhodothermales bacterium]